MPATSETSSRARAPSSAPLPKLRMPIGTTATTASVAMLEKRCDSNRSEGSLRPRARSEGISPARPPSSSALPRIEPAIATRTTPGRFARSARSVSANSATLPNADCTIPSIDADSRPRRLSQPIAMTGATRTSGSALA